MSLVTSACASLSSCWGAQTKVLLASSTQTNGVALVRDSSAVASRDMALSHQSKPLVTRIGSWHTWNDQIHLQPGQENNRLLLTFTNGADGRPKFTDLKVHLGRQPFVTLKDFGGADVLSCDLTNKLTRGSTALSIQGFGPSGARLNWKLYIERPVITAVNPNPLSLSGTVRVEGKNFLEHTGNMKVLIADKPARLLKSKKNEIELRAPAHLSSGKHDLLVVIDSVKSEPFKVSVNGTPEITWVNMLASPPGEPVTLSGKGFSPVAADNVVTFGRYRAHIVSATETCITCIVPEMHFPQWHLPITVTTNGVPSMGKAAINVDIRVLLNEGIPMF